MRVNFFIAVGTVYRYWNVENVNMVFVFHASKC